MRRKLYTTVSFPQTADMCPVSASIKAGTKSLEGLLNLEPIMSSQQQPFETSGGEGHKQEYSNNNNNGTSGTPEHYRMPVR